MKNTVYTLRKALKLNQEKLGERLGVGKTAISKIEKGENGLTDTMIKLICKEYDVNENWLRTGEGEMFVVVEDKYKLERLFAKLSAGDNQFKKDFIVYMLEKSDEDWEEWRNMIIEFNRIVEMMHESKKANHNDLVKYTSLLNKFPANDKIELSTDEEINKELMNYKRELEAEAKGKTLSVSENTKAI